MRETGDLFGQIVDDIEVKPLSPRGEHPATDFHNNALDCG
jgi:hypothetical protein